MPKEVETIDELNTIKSNSKGKLIVIDFYATWCGPCTKIAPKVAEMETQHKNVVFLKVNVDEAEEVTEKYKISVMPTFIFELDNQILEQVQGANEDKLREAIQKHAK